MNKTDDCLNGLITFIESSFPKKCATCGKVYPTSTQFLSETENMPHGRSSLKEALEEDGTAIVEVFRNCACGSTLMEEFNSRRVNSPLGQQTRAEFDRLLNMLKKQNIPIEIARTELVKLFKGKKSESLDYLLTNTLKQDKNDR